MIETYCSTLKLFMRSLSLGSEASGIMSPSFVRVIVTEDGVIRCSTWMDLGTGQLYRWNYGTIKTSFNHGELASF